MAALPVLALFLMACALGFWCVRGASADTHLRLAALQALLCWIILLGASIVAAEAGQIAARTLGLACLLVGSAGLVAGLGAMERATTRRSDGTEK